MKKAVAREGAFVESGVSPALSATASLPLAASAAEAAGVCASQDAGAEAPAS